MLALVIVIVLVVVVFSSVKKPTETGPIKLGFISVLSGDTAVVGEIEKTSTEMAVKEINDVGGINGRKIEIIYEDGKCNGKEALNAINKLMTVDKVKVVLGGSCSSETMAIIPVINGNKILLFSAASSQPSLTGASKYFFRNFPSDLANATVDGGVMAGLYKKVAFVSENGDYPNGIEKVMKDIFKEKGVQVVSDEVYNAGTKDFKTIFAKVKDSGAEAVYLNPMPASSVNGIMLKQAREMGLTIPIHGNLSFMSAEVIKNAGKYIEGLVSSDSTTLSDKGLVVLEKYKKLYGKDPASNIVMGSNYDRVYIITQAIKAVGYDSDKIANYLQGMKEYDGTIGKYHFDKNGDIAGVGFMAVTVKNGKEVPYVTN